MTLNNVQVNVYDIAISIGGNHYTGSGGAVLAVYDPSLGFITGGGAIARSGRHAKAMLNGVGNHTFRATVVDNGEPGGNDRFGLQVIAPGGAIISDLTFNSISLSIGKHSGSASFRRSPGV
jgi:hypothetical protein